MLVTNVLSSTIQNVIHWQCHHSKSQLPNDYTTSCQPDILNHYQKPTNCMFWSLHIILTRASRYSTLLSNVVSFSFSTASRERQDMSVIKQTEINPWVINIWVLTITWMGFTIDHVFQAVQTILPLSQMEMACRHSLTSQ